MKPNAIGSYKSSQRGELVVSSGSLLHYVRVVPRAVCVWTSVGEFKPDTLWRLQGADGLLLLPRITDIKHTAPRIPLSLNTHISRRMPVFTPASPGIVALSV